jgi:serine/threonine protein kinase
VAETLITDRRSQSAHYKILRRLGKGGMAEVFLARQEGLAGLRRLTVVKKLLPQFSQMADVAEMLLDEARIAAQLTHPNIVQIFELGKEDGQYFIVMEFVDGCDLATLARIERHRQGRVPLRLTVRAVSEAAMGLDFAHRQVGLDGRPLNIVHRDVSPHNILCSREGAVKVTDFGIAKAVGKAQVTQVGVVKGKVHYMSPEQYTGGPVDLRSDIYSLGVVLYQLTTGKLPRVGEDGEVVMRRVLEGRLPPPSEIRQDYPEELEAIVLRALAHDPDNRYPDAAALRDDLLDFARENDLLAFPKDLGDYVNAMVPAVPLVVKEQSVIQASLPDAAEPSLVRRSSPGGRLPSVIVEGEDLDTDAPSGTEPASPSAQRRNSPVVADRGTGPFDRTHPSSHVAGARLKQDEQPTPRGLAAAVPPVAVASMPEISSIAASESGLFDSTPGVATPATVPGAPLREQPLQPREAHLVGPDPTPAKAASAKSGAPAAGEEASSGERTPATTGQTRTSGPSALTATTGRRPFSPLLWIAAVSGVVTLGAVGVALWLMSGNRPTPPPPIPAKVDPQPGTTPPGAGVINVLSNPSTTTVSIDGAQRCPSTPCQVAGLPLNRELLITLRAQGYTLWMQRMVLTPSEPKLLLRADLSPEPTAPVAAPDAGKPPVVEDKKGDKAGKKVAVKKGGKSGEGRSGATKGPAPVAKQAGKAKSQGKMVTVDIEEAEAVLTVDVRPWAEVWVDGQKIGHTPMQKAIPPGPHKVELKNPDLGYSKTYRIRAQLKKKVKISEALQPPPGAPGG